MKEKGLIGVQMSTIAPNKMPHFDAYETMAKLTDLGYHCVEISQVPMTKENVEAFRRSIEELHMNVAALSCSVAPMVPGMPGEYLSDPEGFKKIVEDCRALECDMLRIGMLPFTSMGSFEKAVDFAKEANEYTLKLKEEGIDLYYHNHHVEFTKYDGKYLLDIIREYAPDMGFELDIHWIHHGGLDPVKVIRDYAGRIRLLHLKDYRIAPMPIPEGGLDLTSREALGAFMANFKQLVQFAEVGEGSLDIKACIDEGLKGGSEYFLIEQDDCYGRDPFESLRISRDNLIKLGYGDWF